MIEVNTNTTVTQKSKTIQVKQRGESGYCSWMLDKTGLQGASEKIILAYYFCDTVAVLWSVILWIK